MHASVETRFSQLLAEISLRELAQHPTTLRTLDFDRDEITIDERYPDIEVSEIDECATTLPIPRVDASFAWFDKPEDVIALVPTPEPKPPHHLRVPVLLVTIAAATVGALVALGTATGVLVL